MFADIKKVHHDLILEQAITNRQCHMLTDHSHHSCQMAVSN